MASNETGEDQWHDEDTATVGDMSVRYGYERQSAGGKRLPWVKLALPYKVVDSNKPLAGQYGISTLGDAERWTDVEDSLQAENKEFLISEEGEQARFPITAYSPSSAGVSITDDPRIVAIVERLPQELRDAFNLASAWATEGSGRLRFDMVHYPPVEKLLSRTRVPELQWHFFDNSTSQGA